VAEVPPTRMREEQATSGFDLLVLAGNDAGKRFTFEGPEALIGSSLPPGGGIELSDPTISERHAVLRMHRENLLIELLDPLASPLRINDLERARGIVRPGDRVAIGRVVLEVRLHEGLSLSGVLQRREGPSAPRHSGVLDPMGLSDESTLVPSPTESADGAQTLLRPMALVSADRGHLNVIQGGELVGRARFELDRDVLTVGRAHGSDIEVADRGVSRAHAEFVWEDACLVLFQKSPANFTFVNGERVTVSRRLKEGDKIQIADVLLLEVEGLPKGDLAGSGPASFGDLSSAMEARLKLERQIEAEFLRRGSMLDVDVAGSSEMKEPGTSPAHIILSFERFRDYVANTVREFGGCVLNSNGDELMCFFEDTHQAVRAGSAILERLDEFNKTQNLLSKPFRFRLGIHTGDCLVDLVHGRAFSPLVDLAGHLQKAAGVNELVISADTLAALPKGVPFELVGELERHALQFYRLTSFIR